MTPKNPRQLYFSGQLPGQIYKKKAHDLTQLQVKSDQADPVRVQQYERD